MKTYTESEGLQPFDWNKAIDDAINSEPSHDEWRKLKKLAADWVTCACGNQCVVLPRDQFHAPIDGRLRLLGEFFVEDIIARNWREAVKTLSDIEQRSAELIAEINAKGDK